MTRPLAIAAFIFLLPMLIGLSGGAVAIAGGAADVATRGRSSVIRLWAVAVAAGLTTVAWSSMIVWLLNHTLVLSGWSRLPIVASSVALGLAPVLFALHELPVREQPMADVEPIERPALMIAAILNAVFLAIVLA